MNSVEKVYMALEELADADDDELREALPIPAPPAMIRSVLPAIGRQVPENAADLDEFLTNVGNFVHTLRSDDYQPAEPTPELANGPE
jgi:hypothetical protein